MCPVNTVCKCYSLFKSAVWLIRSTLDMCIAENKTMSSVEFEGIYKRGSHCFMKKLFTFTANGCLRVKSLKENSGFLKPRPYFLFLHRHYWDDFIHTPVEFPPLALLKPNLAT